MLLRTYDIIQIDILYMLRQSEIPMQLKYIQTFCQPRNIPLIVQQALTEL